MKTFRFKLDPVLQLREREEQACLRIVASIDRERVALEDRLRSTQHVLVDSKSEWSGELTGELDITALRTRAHASLHAVRQAQELAIQLAGVHQRLQRARATLSEAIRRRRAIELLRDQAFEAWRREEDRRETAELDDITSKRPGHDGPLEWNDP